MRKLNRNFPLKYIYFDKKKELVTNDIQDFLNIIDETYV